MTIVIDDPKFQQILEVTLGDQPISPLEIRTIGQLVQLAASTDLDDDPAEWAVLRTVMARLCARGEIAPDSVPLLSPVPSDDEERAARIARLVPRLTTTGARDLAFALAYLVIVADLELAPVESALLERLQGALTIPRERAGDVVAAVAQIVTPDEAGDASAVATPC
ncbi:MAG TPA: hypothetical protein VGD37_13035 [Kofleriaceae bacterium]|jgi:hypothetical protein